MQIRECLTYDDVLLEPHYSEIETRSSVSLESKLGEGLVFDIPIIASPMDTVSEDLMAIELGALGGVAVIHRYNTIEQQAAMVAMTKKLKKRVGAAVGATGDFMERTVALVNAGTDFICIDVAHGHHKNVYEAIRKIRDSYGPSLHLSLIHI